MNIIAYAVGEYQSKLSAFCAAGNFLQGGVIERTYPDKARRRNVASLCELPDAEVIILGSTEMSHRESMKSIALQAIDHKAARINYVYGYFKGSRKDRRDTDRATKLEDPTDCIIANEYALDMGLWLQAAMKSRHFVLDIHNPETLKAFAERSPNSESGVEIIPDELLAEIIRKHTPDFDRCCIVSADHGRHSQVKRLAELLGCRHALVDATRLDESTKRIEDRTVIGDASGCDVWIREDILSGGGTLATATPFWKNIGGARSIRAIVTHADPAPGVVERLTECPFLEEIHLTDSSYRSGLLEGTSRFVFHESAGFLGRYMREKIFVNVGM